MSERRLFVGVDVGASRTKLVVLDEDKKLIGHTVRKSGTDFTETAEIALQNVLAEARLSRDDLTRCVSTGYGRRNVLFSQDTLTEIGCHAKGCFHAFPMAMTIIDIGGQDNKIIKLDTTGAA
jgi:(R)-2-hydroxyacyl-CoA dehydratese activating ATPase